MKVATLARKAINEGHRRRSQPRRTTRVSLPSLVDFAESTVNFRLHSWQRDHLCPLLERIANEKGARILIHAPPQYGKSFLISQRYPAWLLGAYPEHRVAIACYNSTHATNFCKIARDLMLEKSYVRTFGQDSAVPPLSSGAQFKTMAMIRNRVEIGRAHV